MKLFLYSILGAAGMTGLILGLIASIKYLIYLLMTMQISGWSFWGIILFVVSFFMILGVLLDEKQRGQK